MWNSERIKDYVSPGPLRNRCQERIKYKGFFLGGNLWKNTRELGKAGGAVRTQCTSHLEWKWEWRKMEWKLPRPFWNWSFSKTIRASFSQSQSVTRGVQCLLERDLPWNGLWSVPSLLGTDHGRYGLRANSGLRDWGPGILVSCHKQIHVINKMQII